MLFYNSQESEYTILFREEAAPQFTKVGLITIKQRRYGNQCQIKLNKIMSWATPKFDLHVCEANFQQSPRISVSP